MADWANGTAPNPNTMTQKEVDTAIKTYMAVDKDANKGGGGEPRSGNATTIYTRNQKIQELSKFVT